MDIILLPRGYGSHRPAGEWHQVSTFEGISSFFWSILESWSIRTLKFNDDMLGQWLGQWKGQGKGEEKCRHGGRKLFASLKWAARKISRLPWITQGLRTHQPNLLRYGKFVKKSVKIRFPVSQEKYFKHIISGRVSFKFSQFQFEIGVWWREQTKFKHKKLTLAEFPWIFLVYLGPVVPMVLTFFHLKCWNGEMDAEL